MSAPQKNTHFLVVDDDVDSRQTIVEYLKTMGFERVTEAGDGAEATRILNKDPSINFIISDWEMPLMNGFILLNQVKSNPTRSQTPFLIVTSPISEEAEKVILAAENLVDAYLIKPFRLQVLQDKVQSMLANPLRGQASQVLLVDDDPDAREMVSEYLRRMSFKEIVVQPNGRAAMDYLGLNYQRVGLIVSDWEMPELSGIEFLKLCKQNPSLEKIPFLMITSQSSIERMKVMQAARSNVDEYLLKPFNLEEIRKRIDGVLEKSRTRGEVIQLLKEANDALEHGSYQRAELFFQEVLKLSSGNDTALRGLGDVLMKVKGVDAALPFYKKAVESNPTSPSAYLRLSAAYEQLGMLEKAVSLLQTANQSINFSAELHYHLGRLYNKRSMAPSAKKEFEKALEIQLDHQGARLMLEMINKNKGDAGE